MQRRGRPQASIRSCSRPPSRHWWHVKPQPKRTGGAEAAELLGESSAGPLRLQAASELDRGDLHLRPPGRPLERRGQARPSGKRSRSISEWIPMRAGSPWHVRQAAGTAWQQDAAAAAAAAAAGGEACMGLQSHWRSMQTCGPGPATNLYTGGEQAVSPCTRAPPSRQDEANAHRALANPRATLFSHPRPFAPLTSLMHVLRSWASPLCTSSCAPPEATGPRPPAPAPSLPCAPWPALASRLAALVSSEAGQGRANDVASHHVEAACHQSAQTAPPPLK